MLKIIKETVLKPLLQRLGTVAATAMVVGGEWVCQNWQACGLVTENGADQVATYVIAVALLAFDLLTQHLDRAKGK
jgi:hypothetical protein